MFRILRRFIVLLTMVALLAMNVLTLTVSGVNAFVSGLIATAFGVATVTSALHSRLAAQQNETKKMASKVAAQRAAAKRMGTRLISRSKRMAVRTMASMPAKTIPILGATLIIGGVIWELKDLCDGLRDVEDLYSELEIDDPVDESALHAVCHSKP